MGKKSNGRTQYDPITNNKQMVSAAKEDATDSTATTATMSMIATCTTENKPTKEGKAKTKGPMTSKEIAENAIGFPYHEIFSSQGGKSEIEGIA